MIVAALTTTLLPRLSTARHVGDSRNYLRRIWHFLLPTAGVLFSLIFLAPPLLVWIAGAQYAGISNALKLQLAATLVMVLANPIGLVLVGWGWSRFFAILNLVQLAVDLALDLLWIPRFGVEGALAATLVINALGLVTIYAAVWLGIRNKAGHEPV
jgi:O-antigen/teichoic acid export membrane protein